MTKIAFVIDTIESPTAGTEKQLLLLIRHLDRKKFVPHLFVLRSSTWLETCFNECPLHVVGLQSFKKPEGYRRLGEFSRILKREGFHIVHTHFRDSNIAGIVAARMAGIKTIISARRNQGYWLSRRELWMLKVLNRWVSLFLANSKDTKEYVARVESVDRRRIEVIYNAIDLADYKMVSADERAKSKQAMGLPANAPVIGLVANLRPVKGIDVFLRAAHLVRQKNPGVMFVIAGDGPERSRLESLASELGITEATRFLGKREDIPALMGAFDLGVLSSVSESFSNSVVEYMASGLPVVCTNAGGCAEAVEEGANGFVVPVGDYREMASAIESIMQRGQSTAMGALSRQKAEALFSLPAIIDLYHKTYARLVGAEHEIGTEDSVAYC